MNSLKAFVVTSGIFLALVTRHKGIEIDTSKINAIMEILSPRNPQELYGLQGSRTYVRIYLKVI